MNIALEATPIPAAIPVAAAAAVTGGHAAPDDEDSDDSGPICVICHRSMTSARGRRMGTMTLFCGHTYHRFCVQEWRRISNKGEMECPLRCTPASVAARRTLGFVFIA